MAFALIVPQIINSHQLAFQRRDDKAPTDPGVLGLLGRIEEGDFRELEEETSLHIQKDTFKWRGSSAARNEFISNER